jgi:hypothetical protein
MWQDIERMIMATEDSTSGFGLIAVKLEGGSSPEEGYVSNGSCSGDDGDSYQQLMSNTKPSTKMQQQSVDNNTTNNPAVCSTNKVGNEGLRFNLSF